MQAIILAGGLGTRLRERVVDRPKAMAPVAGRPFLDYLLAWLERGGCQRVVLATGHMAELIEQHAGRRHGRMAVDYSHEREPLGTGGAVRRALEQHLKGEPALVLNGDTWLGLDLAAFARWCAEAPDSDGMVLRQVDDVARFGRVTLKDGLVASFGEKSVPGPGLINAGAYWLRERSFQGLALPEVFSIEKQLFEPHVARLRLRGYVAEGAFIDIGVPAEFDRAQTLLPGWVGGA
jgi:D-glycero-alpha-D-manno-heptose 1-phosphate guanylyltransferase